MLVFVHLLQSPYFLSFYKLPGYPPSEGGGVVYILGSFHSLNIRQFPTLVEDSLFRAVQAEPREPFLTTLGVDPVRAFPRGRLGAKVEVHRAVRVLAQTLVERTEREVLCVQEEARRLQAVNGDRPEFAHRHIGRHVKAVVIPAFQRIAGVVVKGPEVETAGAQFCRWAEILRKGDPS